MARNMAVGTRSRAAREWIGRLAAGALLVFGLLAAAGPLSAANLVVNWGFSTGLGGWETSGSVDPVAGFAVLSDDGATESSIHQVVATEPGRHELRFDFWNLTSDTVPDGTFPDLAVATIFLVDDPAAFDPVAGTGFAQSFDLLDSDAGGDAVLIDGGAMESAPIDTRFSTFAFAFDNPLGLAVAVAFRLFDLNFVDDDSRWAVDNVVLTRPVASITGRDEGPFFVIEAGAILEVSESLEGDGWVEVGRAEYPVILVPPRVDGRRTEVRVRGTGTEPVDLLESPLLPGFRRIDFKGGRLQVSGAGLEDWTDAPATPGPAIVADPGAGRLFYRSVLP